MELGPRRLALILILVLSLQVFEFAYFNSLPRNIINAGGGVGLNICSDLPPAICDPNTNGKTGACTSTNNACPSYKGNAAAIGFTGVSTTSATYVSTGFGNSLTIKNGGAVFFNSQIIISMTGGTGRASFQIYKSTIGIPALNAAPNAGDTQVTSIEVLEDVSTSSIEIDLSYLGYDGTPAFPLTAGVHNFYYLCFKTSAFTLNLDHGQMYMIEP